MRLMLSRTHVAVPLIDEPKSLFSSVWLTSRTGLDLKVSRNTMELERGFGSPSNVGDLASANGNTDLVKELLKASPGTVLEMTVSGETSLHLAVKMEHIEAVRTLVEEIKSKNMFGVLSLGDGDGNTALHLAAARRNHLIIEELLKCNASENGGEVVQVNARNKNGLTPLDLALISSSSSSCPCSLGDQHQSNAKTKSLLQQAQERRPKWVPNKPQIHHLPQPSTHSPKSPHTCCSHDTLLIVLTLIALASYQAMLSPPCGIEDNATQFVWFVLCNSTAFFISIATMWVMVRESTWSLAIYVATFGLVSFYHCAVYRASPPGNLRNVAICICLALPFLPFLACQVKSLRLLSRLRERSELV